MIKFLFILFVPLFLCAKTQVLTYFPLESSIVKRIAQNEILIKEISYKITTKKDRKELTDIWQENGITEGKEYAILTNEIYKEWSGMTAKEYKQYKGLRKESLRDNMDNIEIILTDLSEETTKKLAEKHRPQGLEQNKEVARMGGHAAKVAREDIERNLGESVVTKQNRLNYEHATNYHSY